MFGKEVRLQRLMPQGDGRYFGLTVDHAIGRGVLPGLDTIDETIRLMVEGKPNAVTMQKGIAEHCFRPYAGQVPLVLKCTSFGVYHFDEDIPLADVEEAVRMGADAVSVGCIVGGDNQRGQVEMLARYAKAAAAVGMPLISHIYPRGNRIPKSQQYAWENVAYAARVAAEVGVDIVKTNYTGDPESFAKVVAAAPTRVAIAGGENCRSARDFLQMTRDVLDAGGVGATYGRFIFQYRNPVALIRAVDAVIHGDASVREAVGLLEELEHNAG
ncbi:2-amino-3,7-dideoxy-D-threo-hept-6-ulosonate synthase [Pseudoflavonifractor phocaeensis]|uniref:class I fructose-bisphosphate aldolase n=1 Tax=Pseudoflavonifractor phocaeensis TaxID=1870988 RepID=UPI00313C66F4